MGSRLQLGDQPVETNSGMMADTENAYLNSAMSIDLQARNATLQGCRVINPAPGAMRLPHRAYCPGRHSGRTAGAADLSLASAVPLVDERSRVRLYQETKRWIVY